MYDTQHTRLIFILLGTGMYLEKDDVQHQNLQLLCTLMVNLSFLPLFVMTVLMMKKKFFMKNDRRLFKIYIWGFLEIHVRGLFVALHFFHSWTLLPVINFKSVYEKKKKKQHKVAFQLYNEQDTNNKIFSCSDGWTKTGITPKPLDYASC